MITMIFIFFRGMSIIYKYQNIYKQLKQDIDQAATPPIFPCHRRNNWLTNMTPVA